MGIGGFGGWGRDIDKAERLGGLDVLRQFAKENEVELIEEENGHKVTVEYKNWPITILYTDAAESKEILYTRLVASFVAKDELEFILRPKSLLGGLRKSIQTGDPVFDKEFMLEGNDEAKIKKLFSDYEIGDFLKKQFHMSMQIIKWEKHEFLGLLGNFPPQGVNLLELSYPEWVDEIEMLRGMEEMMQKFLTLLARVGSAADADPNFTY